MWAALMGAAAGLGSSIFGGIKAKKAAEKAEKTLESKRQKNDNWFNSRYYQDYTQTAEAQSLLNRANEQARDYVANMMGRNRVAGGTAEEVAAAMENAGQTQASVADKIAAQATQYKHNVDNVHRSMDSDIDNQYYNMYNQRAANATQAANEGMKAGLDLAVADMSANLKYGKGLFESMFKKK